MKRLFYFSDYFLPIAGKLRFASTVIGRFFLILFRRKKTIQLSHLEYSTDYLFENSYLIIKYRFKNALWYNFKNLRTTTQKNIIIFDLKNINTTKIILVVYGFFRNKKYEIEVLPKNRLKTKGFTTIIHHHNELKNITPELTFIIQKPNVIIPLLKLYKDSPAIKHSSFNQTDFL